MCRKETFESLPKWIEETVLHSDTDKPVIRYIVGNKIDEKKRRVISTNQALEFIDSTQPKVQLKTSANRRASQPFHKEYTKSEINTNLPHIDGYFEVSAKNTDGVRHMFVTMVEQVIASGALNPKPVDSGSKLTNYTWPINTIVDLSYPLTKPAEKCYASSC